MSRSYNYDIIRAKTPYWKEAGKVGSGVRAGRGKVEYGQHMSTLLERYFSQNILAKSLHPKCYEHNPGFLRFMKEKNLAFASITDFKKQSIEERGELYRQIAKCVWNPNSLLPGVIQ